jgi:hypothetical protein
LRKAPATEREFNACRTALDRTAAFLWLKAAFRGLNPTLRLALNARPLTARLELPWTANER